MRYDGNGSSEGEAAVATIKDVARRAGVGVGTVSRVLNQSGPVSDATRRRVLLAIQELEFHPSHAARQLATSQTYTIGVILPFLTRPFFVSVLRGIESFIAETHYNFHIYNVETAHKREFYLRQLPFRGRIDGLVIMSLPLHESHVVRLTQAAIPTVLIDTRYPELASITTDNYAGGRMATAHLLSRGHTRIGYIGGPSAPELGFSVNNERRDGYLDTLREQGIVPRPEYVRMDGDGVAWGARMADQLLDLAEPPSAIFAASDELATGAIEAARRRGLQIPGELAIIGYDDIEIARLMGLSTIRQPMVEMGRAGVELLLQRLTARDQSPLERTLPLELIARETTAAQYTNGRVAHKRGDEIDIGVSHR
jgi:LacI family transcriptional regulator